VSAEAAGYMGRDGSASLGAWDLKVLARAFPTRPPDQKNQTAGGLRAPETRGVRLFKDAGGNKITADSREI
jgi:hypothetical protein